MNHSVHNKLVPFVWTIADYCLQQECISQNLTQRIKQLIERYGFTLILLQNAVLETSNSVQNHLKTMGFSI